MAELTKEQMSFLRDQKIPLSLMFNASGMRRADYQEVMRAEEKLFAYGVSACAKGGHTLRSRAGTCIQCDTAPIAYTLRHYGAAWVYVAGSLKRTLLKIGSSKDPEARVNELNRTGYGNTTDWDILAKVNCKHAGAVEFAVHKSLDSYFSPDQYQKQGKSQNSYELFRCGYSLARAALHSSLPPEERPMLKESSRVNHYEFTQP